MSKVLGHLTAIIHCRLFHYQRTVSLDLEIRKQLKGHVGSTRASLMILFHKEKAKRRTIASRMRPEMSLLSWRSFLFGPTIGSLSKLAAAEPLSPRSLQWQLLVTATATNQIPRYFRHKIFIFWRIFLSRQNLSVKQSFTVTTTSLYARQLIRRDHETIGFLHDCTMPSCLRPP